MPDKPYRFRPVREPADAAAHYAAVYAIEVDGRRVGTIRRRADGAWSAVSETGWEGTGATRYAVADRLMQYGLASD